MSYGRSASSKPAGAAPGGRYSSRSPSGPVTAYPVPGASVASARTRCPVISASSLPVRHPRRAHGSPAGISTARPVVRMREQHLPHAAEAVPGAGGGERRPRRQVEQQHAVDSSAVAAARPRPEGGGAGRAGAVGARQSVGGAGAEQSEFHGKIVPRHARAALRARIGFRAVLQTVSCVR